MGSLQAGVHAATTLELRGPKRLSQEMAEIFGGLDELANFPSHWSEENDESSFFIWGDELPLVPGSMRGIWSPSERWLETPAGACLIREAGPLEAMETVASRPHADAHDIKAQPQAGASFPIALATRQDADGAENHWVPGPRLTRPAAKVAAPPKLSQEPCYSNCDSFASRTAAPCSRRNPRQQSLFSPGRLNPSQSSTGQNRTPCSSVGLQHAGDLACGSQSKGLAIRQLVSVSPMGKACPGIPESLAGSPSRVTHWPYDEEPSQDTPNLGKSVAPIFPAAAEQPREEVGESPVKGMRLRRQIKPRLREASPSLDLEEDEHRKPARKKKCMRYNRRSLPPAAVKILREWINRHKYNPELCYPPREVKMSLAKETNLSFRTVDNWLASARARNHLQVRSKWRKKEAPATCADGDPETADDDEEEGRSALDTRHSTRALTDPAMARSDLRNSPALGPCPQLIQDVSGVRHPVGRGGRGGRRPKLARKAFCTPKQPKGDVGKLPKRCCSLATDTVETRPVRAERSCSPRWRSGQKMAVRQGKMRQTDDASETTGAMASELTSW